MSKQTKFKFVLILLIAIILRFYQLSSLPYPLNNDEKAFGYYSWSISHFGTDEYGNKFPLYFPSIGDYKYPIYTYLLAPFSLIFGLNDFLPRSISAISSILMIFVLYKFTYLLFKSEKISLISSFLLAISPWNLTFSRTASESNLMTFISFLGFYFLYTYLFVSKKIKNIFLSSILFLISIYTYSASRVFIPCLLFCFLFYFFVSKNKSLIKIIFIFFITSIFVVFCSSLNPASRARANNISIFSKSENRVEWITQSFHALSVNQPFNRFYFKFFFNKGSALLKDFIQRYLSHFSFDYMFLNGDIVKLNSIHNFGNFYLVEIFFFIIGFTLIINKLFKNKFNYFLIFSGILTSPIASSFSIETPSAVRQLIGLPYFIIAISLGINFIISKYNLLLIPTIFVYFYSFIFLILSLFKLKPNYQPWTTDQGNQQLVEKIWQIKNSYKYVFIPNDPYIDFLFYKKISPKNFILESTIKLEKIGQWNRVDRYQNIYFNVPRNCPKVGQVNALYVCLTNEIPQSAKIIDVIKYSDNVPKYLLIEFVKDNSLQKDLPTGVKYVEPKDFDTRWPDSIFDNPSEYFLNFYL